jgi:hypothetical protein
LPEEGKTLDALDVVQGTAENKVVGVGRGTCQSPRHLSCLLSRTYRTGCNGFDDCGRPRSNAVDPATQVRQQSTRYQGHKAELVVNEAELVGTSSSNRVAAVPRRRAADLGTLRDPNQARSLGRKHWPSKQGVLAWSIGQASRESQLDSSVEQ